MQLNKVIAFGLFVLLIACVKPQSGLQIKNENNKFLAVYNKLERLQGLYPFIQEKGTTQIKSSGNFEWMIGDKKILITPQVEDSFIVLKIKTDSSLLQQPDKFIGCFFDSIPGMVKGITIWRYKPWNSWTKPIRINHPKEMQDWDIQFFYWQYTDGTYGAAMPLSGNGYRTTIGNHNGHFGVKSVRNGGKYNGGDIPQMVIGFGNDPYKLFNNLHIKGMQSIGKNENLFTNKKFPERLNYIGWCTWNSSEQGRNLNEKHVLESVKSFKDSSFQLGWIIIDDGWFDNSGARLNSFHPNKEKFPNGFKSLNQTLKLEFGLKEIGLWHALNGYWNGINPDSEIGRHFQKELFSWDQKERPDLEDAPIKTYYFIKPESDSLYPFFNNWHKWMKAEGFSFVKVDNQLVTERMSVNNYPIFTMSEKMHEAINRSVFEQFDGAMINCMDMTAEAYLNFGKTAVARAVEDYFPFEDGGVGYKMEKGNATAHLIMAIYNSLYFGNMVFPDFDMFQSHNPDAKFHAVARAINNGPVYLTDKPGRQDFGVLRPLVYSDGSLIRSHKALLPTEDCLFQLQDNQLFKAFSMVNKTGLLAAFNMADTSLVTGSISPAQIDGITGEKFFVYEYFSAKSEILSLHENVQVELNRMGCKLFYIIPIENDFAAIGLADKYNAPATISKIENAKGLKVIYINDGGYFKAYSKNAPKSVTLDDKEVDFKYDKSGIISLQIPVRKEKQAHKISIGF